MSEPAIPLTSVALRLVESVGAAWWLVVVPRGEESLVAAELQEEFEALGESARVWPGADPSSASPITLLVVTEAVLEVLLARVDAIRSELMAMGVLVFVVAEQSAGRFLHAAPHVASFIGGKVIATSTEEGEAPAEVTESRLASLRDHYGMSDDEAREAYEAGRGSSTLDLLEWMVLLNARSRGPEHE